MTDLASHPGYLGWTSRGAILLHADWPMYPAEHGPETALLTLGQYPEGTAFKVLDDIDQCLLFFVGDPRKQKDPYDPRHLHVALWHEDLFSLYESAHVSSLLWRSATEANRAREDELLAMAERGHDPKLSLSIEQIRRELAKEREAALISEDPEDFFAMDWIDQEQARADVIFMMHLDGIRLTAAGLAALRNVLLSKGDTMHPTIRECVGPLMAIRRWDAAIREACVLLETRIKTALRSQSYGEQLIDQFVADLRPRMIGAQLKVLRGELRTAFRYIRNEFMHNVRVLQEDQCMAILVRLSNVFDWVDVVVPKSYRLVSTDA